jgi:flagellar hook-basal body complex protein FliE
LPKKELVMSEIRSLKLNVPSATSAHLEKASQSLGNPVNNDFGDRISNAIRSVANAQNQSAQISKDYELGRETDLSKVMVQQQVSSLGFQLTMNVRNKLLSAYKDIMNMPV